MSVVTVTVRHLFFDIFKILINCVWLGRRLGNATKGFRLHTWFHFHGHFLCKPGYAGVPLVFFPILFQKKLLGIHGTCFFQCQMSFLSPNQQCQSTEYKALTTTKTLLHSLFIHHQTPDGWALLPVCQRPNANTQTKNSLNNIIIHISFHVV